MKTAILTALLVCASSAIANGVRPPKPPDVLTTPGSPHPFFVSAARATGTNGEVNWAAFSNENTRTVLHALTTARRATPSAANNAAAPCDTRTMVFGIGSRHRTVESLARNAQAVYRGRITSATPGFLLTTPVTLVQIEITSRLRGSKSFPSARVIYTTYPAADFTIGEDRFCNSGPVKGFIPAGGDEVLLVADRPPSDTAGLFIPTSEDQLIVARAGRVIAAPSLENSPDAPLPLTLDALASRMVAAERRK